MGATVHYTHEEALIRVREFGVLTADEFAESIRRIREIHDRSGCTRVLVDAREQESRTDGHDAFERASLAARTLAGTGIRLAVIVTGALLEGHSFFEIVSTNRGLRMKVFAGEADARAWLDG